MRLAVVGLGKLGAPLAALLAARGHDVIGVDLDAGAVAAINEGRPPVEETGLAELMKQATGQLNATTDTAAAVAASEATFIIVPTPSGPDGRFSTQYAEAAISAVGAGLKDSDAYHLVVMVSTVMPGDTAGPIKTALESASGRRCGPDLGLCYNPEFIALGSVIADMKRPDMVLVGQHDEKAGNALAAIHASLAENDPPMARLNLEEAELSKIAVNTFVTMRLAYANMLAQACEHLPGADVDRVTGAIGLDSRVGRHYLKGALGYGGPCFPRDNGALAATLSDLGLDAGLPRTVDITNKLHGGHVAKKVLALLPAGGTVGILGLAYKPGTGVIEESAAIALTRALTEQGVAVIAHDPMALAAANDVFGGAIECADDMASCAKRADLLIVAVPWAAYQALAPQHLRPPSATVDGNPPTVVDCWRMLSPTELGPDCRYVAIGRGDYP